MSPVSVNQPPRAKGTFSRNSRRHLLKLLAIGLVVAFVPVALYVSVRSASSGAWRSTSPLGLKEPAVRVGVQMRRLPGRVAVLQNPHALVLPHHPIKLGVGHDRILHGTTVP